MKKLCLVVLALICASVLTASAGEKEKTQLRATLVGIEETPQTVITPATGTFTATLNNDSTITFTLTYKNLSSPAVQSHIHIGATKITGGVAIFFCGPVTSPAHQTCPNDSSNSGTVTGTLTAADVLALPAQGLTAGNMTDVARAIATGVTYVNVHNANHPGGEIRGRVRQRGEDEDDELPGAR